MGFKTENGWKHTSKKDYSKSQLNFYKKLPVCSFLYQKKSVKDFG